MTPDKNFRMSKATKTMMAFAKNKEARTVVKNVMIQAQLCEEAAHRAALKSSDTRESRESNHSSHQRGAVAPE